MTHQPVVTNFKIRPPTYPEGHWMNKFWGPLAYGLVSVISAIPFYRHVLRAHPATQAVLKTGEPVIFTCIHQDVLDCIIGLPRLMQDRQLAAMVSYSRDGGLGAMGLQMLGYEIIRGSSSRGGGEGLLMLRSCLGSDTSVVFVSDGPKAPLGDIKPGVVRLAASSGAPIVPVRAWGLNRGVLWRSWTKTAITMPFQPIAVCLGAPIRVPDNRRDLRPYQIAVARSIHELAKWASRWANGPNRAHFNVATE